MVEPALPWPNYLYSLKRTGSVKKSISKPFDFQHVTHTKPAHFGSFERASKNELISEFSAIRAGQRSTKEIQGIKTKDIPVTSNPLAESGISESDSPLTSENSTPSTPTTTLPFRTSSRNSTTPPRAVSQARSSRSVENFSRPSPRSPLSPITPPDYISCNGFTSAPLSQPRPNTCFGVGNGLVAPLAASSWPLVASTVSLPARTAHEGAVFEPPTVGHAVTTNDGSARQLRINPLPPLPTAPSELTDVPEGEEGNVRLHDLTQTHPQQGGRSSLRHAQSFPSSKGCLGRGLAASTQTRRHITQHHVDVKSQQTRLPRSPNQTYNNPGKAERPPSGLGSVELDDWEMDVDYCYEHAAEADSEFAWDKDTGITCRQAHRGHALRHDSRRSGPTQPCKDLVSNVDKIQLKTTTNLPAFKPLPPVTLGDFAQDVVPASSTSRPAHVDLTMPPNTLGPALGNRCGQILAPTPLETLEESSTLCETWRLPDIPDNDQTHPLMLDAERISHVRQSESLRSSSNSSLSKYNSQDSIVLSIVSSLIGIRKSCTSCSSLNSLTDLVQSVSSTKDRIDVEVPVENGLAETNKGPATSFLSPRITTGRDKDSLSGGQQNCRSTEPLLWPEVVAERSPSASQPPQPQLDVAPSQQQDSSAMAHAASSVDAGRLCRVRKVLSANTSLRSRSGSRTSYSLFPSPLSTP